MRSRETQLRDTIDRVSQFLDMPALESSRFDVWRARIQKSKTELDQLFFRQHFSQPHRRSSTAMMHDAAAKLRHKVLLRIARPGRKLLKHLPGAERALRVPPKRANPAAILAAADKFGTLCTPKVRKLFIDHGFEPELFTQLDTLRKELKVAVRERDQSRAEGPRAAAQARAALRRARADLVVLEAVLQPLFDKEPGLEKVWNTSRRPQGKPGRKSNAQLRRRATASAKQAKVTSQPAETTQAPAP